MVVNLSKKKSVLKKNQISNNLTNATNMRVQTLPDTKGLNFETLMKYPNRFQQNTKPIEKKYNTSKEIEELNLKKVSDSSHSNLKRSNLNQHFSDYVNRNKDENKKIPAERDLSNHSAKSSHSVNVAKKPLAKNPNINDKTANYTIHIAKEKPKENEGLNINVDEKLLLYVKMNEYERCLEVLEKNRSNKLLLNINYKGENDWTPLHYASLNGNLKILNALLFNEAVIDSETSSKLTPLMITCQK